MKPVTDPSILAALNEGAGEAAPPTDRARLLDAVRYTESRGNPNAVSPAGAVGAYQFMPDTARQFGLDPRDPNASRVAADKYLTQLEKQFGNEDLALLAYNWGPGNVQAWLKTGRGMRGQPMPLEAQEYGGRIRGNLDRIQGRLSKTKPAVRQPREVTDPALLEQLNSMAGAGVKPEQPALPSQAAQPEPAVETFGDNIRSFKKTLEGYADRYTPDVIKRGQQIVEQGRKEFENVPVLGALASAPGNIRAFAEGATGLPLADEGASVVPKVAGGLVGGAALGGAAAQALGKAPLLARALQSGNRVPRTLGLAAQGAGAGAASALPAAATAAINSTDGAPGVAAAEQLGLGVALGGAMGPVVPGAVGAVGAAVRKPAEVAGKYLQSTFGPRTQEAIAALRNLRPMVPGEQPTAGMAATPRLPEFKVLEQNARNAPPTSTMFPERDALNAAARSNPLEAMALPARPVYDAATNRAMSPIEALREHMTKPLYQAAQDTQVQLSPTAERVLRRYRTPSGQPNTIGELQAVKAEIDSDIAALTRGTDAASRFRLRELQATKKELVDAMQGASPTYGAANQLYGSISQHQNRGQVAQELLDALRTPSGIGEQRQSFLRAMQNVPRTLQRADLSPRFTDLNQVMTPQQMQTIQGINSSVERQAAVDALRAGNVEPYMSPMTKVEQFLPSWFSKVSTLVRGYSKKLGLKHQSDVERVISEAVMDPSKMAELLAATPPASRAELVELFKNAGIAGAVNQNQE